VAKLLLTEEQRTLLKKPLGELVIGDASECNRKLREIQENEKPRRFILVGDSISRNAQQTAIRPDVIIIDRREKRDEATDFELGKSHLFKTRNDPGTIDLLAWNAVAEAVERGDSAVLVEGEEDLLTLAAIMVSPVGSCVAYGQPGEGIVIVRVSAQKKNEIGKIVDAMQRAD
jgi:uncharacterized protein (UPF0218 family)